MEHINVKNNDIEKVLNEINEDFPDATGSTFFVAQYTDKFDVGIWNKDIIKNVNKLLELRVFDKNKEWKLFRSDIGKDFSYRCQKEDNTKEEGADYFDEVQLLDIDTSRSKKAPGVMHTTAGGSYNLPKDIEYLDRAAIRVCQCFGVDSESGQAFIIDYRLVDFESADKREYSKDLKGENNEL
ncbi:hypothetical protein HMPREF9099_03143 [Lachnospiraceae bacterium oral taxon 082 str. F0431]|nr:hypothetical protein HMPREF9099_03143 [Lachnospiraceae bacterium oral taxon 082 str. F0431]